MSIVFSLIVFLIIELVYMPRVHVMDKRYFYLDYYKGDIRTTIFLFKL